MRAEECEALAGIQDGDGEVVDATEAKKEHQSTNDNSVYD